MKVYKEYNKRIKDFFYISDLIYVSILLIYILCKKITHGKIDLPSCNNVTKDDQFQRIISLSYH